MAFCLVIHVRSIVKFLCNAFSPFAPKPVPVNFKISTCHLALTFVYLQRSIAAFCFPPQSRSHIWFHQWQAFRFPQFPCSTSIPMSVSRSAFSLHIYFPLSYETIFMWLIAFIPLHCLDLISIIKFSILQATVVGDRFRGDTYPIQRQNEGQFYSNIRYRPEGLIEAAEPEARFTK